MILRRVETATGEITDLVTGDWITGPDVSPDGAQVVFAVDPDFHADLAWGGSNDQSDLSAITSALYLVDTRGGSATRLTGPGDGGTHAAWSPDGRQIAYTCQIGESGGDLCLIDVDGGRVTPLIATPDLPEGKPTWSPDGRRIAFHSNQGSGWGIYAIDVGSKKIEQLFDVRDGLEIADPAWSPDGASIATAAGELSEDGGVCIRPLVGEASCFAGGPSGDWAPDWALDGQLVFNGYAFDVEYHLILILDPATGTTRWLVPGLGMRDAPTP